MDFQQFFLNSEGEIRVQIANAMEDRAPRMMMIAPPAYGRAAGFAMASAMEGFIADSRDLLRDQDRDEEAEAIPEEAWVELTWLTCGPHDEVRAMIRIRGGIEPRMAEAIMQNWLDMIEDLTQGERSAMARRQADRQAQARGEIIALRQIG